MNAASVAIDSEVLCYQNWKNNNNKWEGEGYKVYRYCSEFFMIFFRNEIEQEEKFFLWDLGK